MGSNEFEFGYAYVCTIFLFPKWDFEEKKKVKSVSYDFFLMIFLEVFIKYIFNQEKKRKKRLFFPVHSSS